ncbi:MAG TPA: folylpolyglutamate synthase/dihydrofolate synthase family protein [Salinimicrobium sp.]|nr:folylpolyglutamate synthase/dihydrofolate synthase family protein [Salinimicrobium sp.]
MTYQETVEWMFRQLPMYQQVGKSAYKNDLSNIIKLAAHLNNPQRQFKSIHVAGTNGKGSTSHMLASVFQEAGYKTGLYTSPHLKDFRERVKINGKEIPENYVIDFMQEHRKFFEENNLSFFEMSVGLAFDFFASEKVDITIIEVGLGGRLDSTNIISPELSIITNIGLDHTQILGDSLEKIAAEKAGIIKEGIPVVIGKTSPETKPVFEDFSNRKNAPIIFAEDYTDQIFESDLKGAYQKENKATVLQALAVLRDSWKISDENIKSGLLKVVENTGLRGRWEVLQQHPKVIGDTAHNEDGLKWTLKQLLQEDFDSLHIVLGVVNDKDLSKILNLFPKWASYYFGKPDVPRGLEAENLRKSAAEFGLVGKSYPSISEAYVAALHHADLADVIYVGGSTFTVAEII